MNAEPADIVPFEAERSEALICQPLVPTDGSPLGNGADARLPPLRQKESQSPPRPRLATTGAGADFEGDDYLRRPASSAP